MVKRNKTQTFTRLKIIGNKKSLRKFVKASVDKNGNIDILNRIVPIHGPSQDQVEKWGAIFGDYDQKIVRQSDTEIVFEFWSYYDPLVKGLTLVSGLFPDLTFIGGYYTTLKATMGHYTIHDGKCNHGALDPTHSLEMKNFCCEWDENMENLWFALAENYVADMIGEPSLV